MKYEVVSAMDSTTLERRVHDMMLRGWKPLGGVAAATGNPASCTKLYQAMMTSGWADYSDDEDADG